MESAPSIWRLAIGAWRDAFGAMRDMPVVFGAAFAAAIVIHVAQGFFGQPSVAYATTLSSEEQVAAFAFALAQTFFLTPVLIAVHRYILLGERTRRYRLNPSDRRFWRFFVFGIVIQLFFVVPTLFALNSSLESGVELAVAVVLFLAAIVAAVRLILFFPAVAVDAAGADWRNALADSRGHAWRIFFTVMVVTLMATVVLMAAAIGLAWISLQFDEIPRAVIVIDAIIEPSIMVATLAANAVAASRLFRFFGMRLVGSAGG